MGTYRVRQTFITPRYAYSTSPLKLTLAAGQVLKGQLLGTKRL